MHEHLENLSCLTPDSKFYFRILSRSTVGTFYGRIIFKLSSANRIKRFTDSSHNPGEALLKIVPCSIQQI